MDNCIKEIKIFNSNVKAFYSTRNGGFSKEPYSSLNLGLHVGDDKDNVLLNRKKVKEYFSNKDIVYMDQIHSSNVTYIDKYSDVILKTDALITDKKDLVLAVMTADCLPLLLASDNYVAAIHCGWRGVALGIIENVCKFLKDKNENLDKAKAFLGPCIGPDSFEVGIDVLNTFKDLDNTYEDAFLKKDIKDKYLCNLPLICNYILKREGIFNIYNSELDTFKLKDSFFSYRRDKDTGRMASFIYLDK